MKKIIILILLISFGNVFSQVEDRRNYNSYGFFTGLNYNIHSASFVSLPGIPNCCSEFESATGVGLSIGLLSDFQTNNILEHSGFDIRLSFDMLDAEFNVADLNNGNVVNPNLIDQTNPQNTDIENVNITHNLITALSIISLEPTYRYSPIYDLNLHLGFKFGIPIASSFNQNSVITSPDYVVFKDTDGFKRNVTSGDEIPEINGFNSFLALGVGFEFPIEKKLYIIPELKYYLALNNINIDDWKPNHMRFGVAFKYYSIPRKEKPVIIDTLYKRDTLIVANPNITEPKVEMISSDIVENKDETEDRIFITKTVNEKYEKTIPKEIVLKANLTGDIEDVKQIVIEELEMEEGFPLLPYIFFTKGNGGLNNTSQKLRYPKETDDKVWNYSDMTYNFNEDSLEWNTLDIHGELLNIVGKRMKNNPNAEITVIGTNNNTGIEKQNIALSEERANSVKDYLVGNWGISSSKIKTKSRNLPAIPGNPDTPDGLVENQRAEIESDDYDILKPVFLKDIVKVSNPPIVNIMPDVSSSDSESQIDYNLTIKQDDNILRLVNKEQIGSNGYDWNVLEDPQPLLDMPVEVVLEASDQYGNKASDNKTTEVEQLTIKKKRFELKDDNRIEKFALIVFDYDKSTLSNRHKKVLDEIKSRIKPNSKITIEGYTDRTGSANYNKKLAQRRAEEVKKYIGSNINNITLKSIGESKLLYNNDIPQGRNFSRTVLVKIVTPIE
jgi:outer membrane protein OmpA-like peptidoglycan-associated protein